LGTALCARPAYDQPQQLGIDMPLKLNLLVLGALFCIGGSLPASAQQVYKCGSRKSVTYSEQPCSNRIVNTDQAPVPAKPQDVRRKEHNRAMARAMRRMPDESAEQFDTRRRRARLMPEDRAECAMLDKRMPVEQASMNNPDPTEVSKAEAALRQSGKRFSELRC
jgi:hypothetical protein